MIGTFVIWWHFLKDVGGLPRWLDLSLFTYASSTVIYLEIKPSVGLSMQCRALPFSLQVNFPLRYLFQFSLGQQSQQPEAGQSREIFRFISTLNVRHNTGIFLFQCDQSVEWGAQASLWTWWLLTMRRPRRRSWTPVSGYRWATSGRGDYN